MPSYPGNCALAGRQAGPHLSYTLGTPAMTVGRTVARSCSSFLGSFWGRTPPLRRARRQQPHCRQALLCRGAAEAAGRAPHLGVPHSGSAAHHGLLEQPAQCPAALSRSAHPAATCRGAGHGATPRRPAGPCQGRAGRRSAMDTQGARRKARLAIRWPSGSMLTNTSLLPRSGAPQQGSISRSPAIDARMAPCVRHTPCRRAPGSQLGRSVQSGRGALRWYAQCIADAQPTSPPWAAADGLVPAAGSATLGGAVVPPVQ